MKINFNVSLEITRPPKAPEKKKIIGFTFEGKKKNGNSSKR